MIQLEFNKSGGLVPAIVQDNETGEVLMLAYMNQEAFDATLSTGKATYFSRSRQTLGVKGETPGNVQLVK
jgi:phosphoribosyl-AMP cyclohydrolase